MTELRECQRLECLLHRRLNDSHDARGKVHDGVVVPWLILHSDHFILDNANDIFSFLLGLMVRDIIVNFDLSDCIVFNAIVFAATVDDNVDRGRRGLLITHCLFSLVCLFTSREAAAAP